MKIPRAFQGQSIPKHCNINIPKASKNIELYINRNNT